MIVYASKNRPIRCSSLSNLQKCSGFHILERGDVLVDANDGSPASDLGRAVGRVVQLYHEGYTPGDALARAEREAAEKFAHADWTATTKIAKGYMADERNLPKIATHCEAEVRLVLPCAPEDPTGEPIHLVGHLDQIRYDAAGRPRVWDLKCGQPTGLDLLYSYAWQVSAYTLAVRQTLKIPALPGGVIRGRAYESAKDPSIAASFYHAPWGIPECEAMMESATFFIALLRKGIIPLNPGAHCQWCPGTNPAVCASRLPAGAP